MEQQQFKISFSVGTKILLSVALLLFLLVTFLSISAIVLLTEDKEAYTFQTKLTEAGLLGGSIADTAQHALDTLRVSLAETDIRSAITQQEREALRSVIENQSTVTTLELGTLDPSSGKIQSLAFVAKDPKMQIPAEITPDWIKAILPELKKNGYSFINVTKTDGEPTAATFLADVSNPLPNGQIPVSIGTVPLTKLGEQLKGLNLTVATRTGWVLYDTDPSVLYGRKNISNDPLFQSSLTTQTKSGTQTYDFKNTRYLGGFSKPGLDLIVLSRAEWQQAMKATYALTEKFILLGAMALGLGVVFAIFFAKTLTAPINRLYTGTQTVAQGQFDLNLEVKGRDEIAALTQSFNVMSQKIQELFKESVEKAVLQKEIDVASTVQRTLIPTSDYADDFIKIKSHYQSATQCGGDWWGMFKVDNKLCFGVADATGHGVPSALITASAHSAFSVLGKLAAEDSEFTFSPAAILDMLNRAIYDSSHGSIMMTFFVGVIDFDAKTLTYANAAHNPPWYFRKDGERFKLNSLTSSGSRLGETQDLAPLEEKTIPIAGKDILFCYTDGLLEGKSLAGDMFGKKRTRQIVEAQLPSGPEALIGTLMQEFMQYNEGKALDDDVTLAAMVFADSIGPSA
jgi:sigma-B regulation protein RsbU (phosphoserine phosphatase)